MVPLIGEARITKKIIDNHDRLEAMIRQMEQYFIPQAMDVESTPKSSGESESKTTMDTEVEIKSV